LGASVERNLLERCRQPVVDSLAAARATLETIDSPGALPSLNEPLQAAQTAYCLAYDNAECRSSPDDNSGDPEAQLTDYVAAAAGRLRRFGVTLDAHEVVDTLLGDADEEARSVFATLRRVAERTVEQRDGHPKLRRAVGWTAFAFTVAVVLAFAGFAVVQSVYIGDATFAGFWKYFALFSAAVGSSTAASVLALFAYWKPQAATSK
jgi:hypothetical protein